MSIRFKLIVAYFVVIIFSVVVMIGGMIQLTAGFLEKLSESTIGDHSIEEVFDTGLNVLVDFEYISRYDKDLFNDKQYMASIEESISDFNMKLFVVYNDRVSYTSQFNQTIPFEEFYKDLDFSDSEHDRRYTKGNEPMEATGHDYKGESYVILRHVIDHDDVGKGHVYLVGPKANMDNVGEQVFGDFFKTILVLILVIIGAMTLLVSQLVIKPLKILENATVRVRQGQLDFSLKTKKNDEIGQVMNAFDTMREELKKSIEQQMQYEENRKELITSISHDLKTPITSIKGYVEGIRDGVASDKDKLDQYLDVIYHKSLDMDQLIDDLFLFSKLDLNRVPFNFSEVNAINFFDDSYQELQLDLEKSGFDLAYEKALGIHTTMSIDPQQFKRIMTNIISNAVKYSGDIKKVILRVYEDESRVRIEIQDFGKGIGPDELGHIFDKFYRCDPSRNTDVAGSGLGLAIAKQIIDQHHGAIWADSEIGKGTTIHISLERIEGGA